MRKPCSPGLACGKLSLAKIVCQPWSRGVTGRGAVGTLTASCGYAVPVACNSAHPRSLSEEFNSPDERNLQWNKWEVWERCPPAD
jgi:hypothetical protein